MALFASFNVQNVKNVRNHITDNVLSYKSSGCPFNNLEDIFQIAFSTKTNLKGQI